MHRVHAMTAMTESSRRRAIIALNRCIELCTDGEKAWGLAAADVRAPTLKAQFLARVRERADFVLELQSTIRSMQAVPENEGTTRGALHRVYTVVDRAIHGRDDRRIVQSRIRGERSALEGYVSAMQRTYFQYWPSKLREMVERQYSTIRRSL